MKHIHAVHQWLQASGVSRRQNFRVLRCSSAGISHRVNAHEEELAGAWACPPRQGWVGDCPLRRRCCPRCCCCTPTVCRPQLPVALNCDKTLGKGSQMERARIGFVSRERCPGGSLFGFPQEGNFKLGCCKYFSRRCKSGENNELGRGGGLLRVGVLFSKRRPQHI